MRFLLWCLDEMSTAIIGKTITSTTKKKTQLLTDLFTGMSNIKLLMRLYQHWNQLNRGQANQYILIKPNNNIEDAKYWIKTAIDNKSFKSCSSIAAQ